MLSLLRKLTAADIGRVIVAVLIVANACFCLFQRETINDLRRWQASIVTATAQAVDQRDSKGALLPVRAKDVAAHIATLGRLKIDLAAAREKARADDAAHALASERQASSINRKGQDDYLDRVNQARATAAALRAADAGGVQQAGGATSADPGGSRSAPVSGLSVARPAADEAAGANGLPLTCEPMTIDERLLATEQAIQLDELIGVIEGFARIGK